MDQNQKTIRVMGVGNVKVAPDTTRLSFAVDSLHKDYETAYAEAAVGNGELQKALQKLGLSRESLKTSDFSISKKTEWSRKTEKYEFVGFKLEQTLAIELSLDSALTSKVMATLGAAWPELEVKITFIKKDSHNVKLQILESAVKDAREKAEVIANTLGHKLGGILNVDYSKHRLEIDVRDEEHRYIGCADSGSNDSIDYTPEDIEASDTVETVWFLE